MHNNSADSVLNSWVPLMVTSIDLKNTLSAIVLVVTLLYTLQSMYHQHMTMKWKKGKDKDGCK